MPQRYSRNPKKHKKFNKNKIQMKTIQIHLKTSQNLKISVLKSMN